jgi:hypothetical protein
MSPCRIGSLDVVPLTEMIIIWLLTAQRYKPIKFTRYLQARERMKPLIYEELVAALKFSNECNANSNASRFHNKPPQHEYKDKSTPSFHIPYQAIRPRPVDASGDPDDDPDDSSTSSSKPSLHFPSWLPKKP